MTDIDPIDQPEESRGLHVWQNPLHVPLDHAPEAAVDFEYPGDDEQPLRRQIELVLQNAGTPFVKIELAADLLESLVGIEAAKQSEAMTAEAISRILWKVPRQEGAALRRVLLNEDGPLRECAESNGCSKSALHRRERAVRKRWDRLTP